MGSNDARQTLPAAADHASDTLSPASALGAYLRTFLTFGPNARRLILGTLAVNTGLGTSSVLFNLYLVANGNGLAFVGLFSAVTTVAQAATGPVVGRLLARVRASRVMMCGTASWAAGTAFATVLPSSPLLLLCAVPIGLGFSAATIPAGPVMISLAGRTQRRHLFSAYFSANMVGTMAGSLVAGAAPLVAVLLFGSQVHGALGIARVGLLLGATLAAAGIVLFWTMDDRRVADIDEGAGADETIVPVRLSVDPAPPRGLVGDVAVMLVATGLIALTLGATMPFFPLYFASRLHVSTATIGLIFGLSGLVCTLSSLASPLVGRWGNAVGFNVTRAASAPLLMLFVIQPGLAVAIFAYVGRNILGTVSGALENLFAMEVVPPRHRMAVAGWRAFVFNVGWSVGSLTTGVVATRWGYTPIFGAAALLTIAGTYIYDARFAARLPAPLRVARHLAGHVRSRHAAPHSL